MRLAAPLRGARTGSLQMDYFICKDPARARRWRAAKQFQSKSYQRNTLSTFE
jgi:hypothetical protein